jgi:hypothetical protein
VFKAQTQKLDLWRFAPCAKIPFFGLSPECFAAAGKLPFAVDVKGEGTSVQRAAVK